MSDVLTHNGRSYKRVPAIDRLHSMTIVTDRGCWEWVGHVNNKGYATIFNDHRRKVFAHRLSFELYNGPIPSGMNVCHRCDNSKCSNPLHLFLGTQADNLRDMREKGRAKFNAQNLEGRGEENRHAKLTCSKVREIRVRYALGERPKSLAREFGVSSTSLIKAARGETWAHVKEAA